MSAMRSIEHGGENLEKRLYRSQTDKMIFGVCGGLGDYFNIDPTVVRIIFVLLTLFHGVGLLAYIILAIVVPQRGSEASQPSEVVRQNLEDMGRSAGELGENLRGALGDEQAQQRRERNRNLAALILVLLGLGLLLSNLGYLWWFNFGQLWPLVLVAIGLALLFGRRR